MANVVQAALAAWYKEHPMHRSIVLLSAGGILTLLLQLGFLDSATSGQEEKIGVEQAPQVVLDAVKARFEGAELTGASKETEEGKPVFEITIKHKSQHIDVTLTPEGEILLIEKQIASDQLPRRVRRALRSEYRRATYKIVEEIVKVEKKEEKLAYYEVLLTTRDNQTLEVQVDPEGKVINVETKKAGDEEEEK
jgi:uncharacterized membrane protein YkoI